MQVLKMSFLGIVFAFFCLMVIESCKTRETKNNTQTSSEFASMDSDSVFVSLDRFPCFGMCPTYKFMLYSSGYALYKGQMSVARIGTYEAHFTKEQMRMFTQDAMENRVDTLRSEYINPYIADFPATYSSIVLKGRRHTFRVSTDTPPESLTAFETTVERLLEVGKWEKISDKTE